MEKRRVQLRSIRRTSRGFTLVEVLAAILLIAIVLPAIMQAITLATRAGTAARYRTQAAALAESKLNEIVATSGWTGANLSGEFGDVAPGFRWQATVQPWENDDTSSSIQQIDLQVIWAGNHGDESVTMSTLAYDRTASTASQ